MVPFPPVALHPGLQEGLDVSLPRPGTPTPPAVLPTRLSRRNETHRLHETIYDKGFSSVLLTRPSLYPLDQRYLCPWVTGRRVHVILESVGPSLVRDPAVPDLVGVHGRPSATPGPTPTRRQGTRDNTWDNGRDGVGGGVGGVVL